MEESIEYRRSAPVVAVVVPCYNESEALPISAGVLLQWLDAMQDKGMAASGSYVLCVDDGSRDDTWQVIEGLHRNDNRLRGISLAHNRGHQYALLAGLMEVRDKCNASISIDADLQDDVSAMTEMLSLYRQGKDIVYGVRSSRATDTAFKRGTAHAFYSFQKWMGLETVYDHADYRLMSSRALDMLAEYGESNLFLRGIVPHIGLDSGVVYYERNSRVAGESKYPLSKMLALSIDGITSFSAKPMRWIFYVGLVIFVLTLVVGVVVLLRALSPSYVHTGWASLMLSIWVLGSVILMSIGIVGEYIGKIFNEVKHRPRYAIKDRLWD